MNATGDDTRSRLTRPAGFGLGIQIPLITVQAVLSMDDVPVSLRDRLLVFHVSTDSIIQTGTAVIMFCQTLGGSLFLAVGQNIFLAKLGSDISKIIPGFDVKALYTCGGATNVAKLLSGELLIKVLDAYSSYVSSASQLSMIMF